MSTPGITVAASGNTNANYFGTGGDDAFEGSSSGEYFYTGGGSDWVYAAGGNDVVVVDFGNDWLHGGGGFDTLSFQTLGSIGGATGEANVDYGVTVDLSKTTLNLGILGTKTIYGFEAVIGSYTADHLYGSSIANQLDGNYGNDLLDGRSGDDTLIGSGGSDTLVGGKGADKLSGGFFHGADGQEVDRDYFRYSSTSESSGNSTLTADELWGHFTGGTAQGDKIDLSRIDANGSLSGNGTFAFLDSAAFHSNATAEVRFDRVGSSDLYVVEISTDKDHTAEMTLFVHSDHVLTKGDFVL